jgi:phosphoribosylformylglycinamidine synthase
VPSVDAVVTPDLKQAGDVLVLVGGTGVHFAGSHFGLVHPDLDQDAWVVPPPDPAAPLRYRRLHALMRTGRVRACHDLSEGGLAVALAEMAIAGRLGLFVHTLPHPDVATALFSESCGRFVCVVAADDLGWFLSAMGDDALVLGHVTDDGHVAMPGIDVPLAEAVELFGGVAR